MAAADLDMANPEIIPDRLHVLILISDAEKHRIGEADSNGSGAGIRGILDPGPSLLHDSRPGSRGRGAPSHLVIAGEKKGPGSKIPGRPALR